MDLNDLSVPVPIGRFPVSSTSGGVLFGRAIFDRPFDRA